MAEETVTCRDEVELDTDGVNEETVSVEQEKETENNSQTFKTEQQEVDLGYSDVSKKSSNEAKSEEDKPLIEIEEESVEETKPKDNLKKRQSDYQKRIDSLHFQIKESERREKAALDYAKGLKKKYDGVEKKFEESDTNYLKEYGARIESDKEKAKRFLKDAIEAQDADKIAESNEQLVKLAVEKEKVAISLNAKEQAAKEKQENPSNTDEIPMQAPISARTQKWAEENAWFGSDRVMTNAAMSLHDELQGSGIETESDEYYNQINKRMKEYFPHKFAQYSTDKETVVTKQPVQNVAGVSRRQGGRKSVKLTKSQVVIAKRLGVPLEEYARYVKGGTNE